MLNWEVWKEENVVNRVTLSDGVDMHGSYVYQMSSDNVITSVWQSSIMANLDTPTAANFKIRGLVRKNNSDGSLYLFVRGNRTTKQAYILEMKDSIRLYKGTLGVDYLSGAILVSTEQYIFPKNNTYHLEFAVHTGQDNKTFFQVKLGDRGDPEQWNHVFSIITSNETMPNGYWGFGCGTYTRREHFYFDDLQYYLEY
jgi:hypothetical protein